MSQDQNEKKSLQSWQKIYVNRSLNMGHIRAVGFDMDHTLAKYHRNEFEALAFRETLKKFIDSGYPEELSRLKFDPNFLIRGLMVDMDEGNLLKVDAHKYVKLAFHGHEKLEKSIRHEKYNSESFKAANLLSMDTFFALSEVQLFTEIVDYMAKNPNKIQKSIRDVYHDLRRFIDLSHADGSIKTEVMSNIEKYIAKDKYLIRTLTSLIESDKSLWLITNSKWEYTNCIMTYLLGDSDSSDYQKWQDYFDYIIVGSGKPNFFVGNHPFYEVIPDSGLLKLHSGPLNSQSVYHGGNAALFQKLTGYRGDEILYVGDHIYGDIMQSKGEFNWRTLLVIEELESELQKISELQDNYKNIRKVLKEREALDNEAQRLRSKVALNKRQADKARQLGENKKSHYLQKEIDKISIELVQNEDLLKAKDVELRNLIEERQAAVHPIWGELMRVGLERSRFADQVVDWACIYTSRLSNLRHYSPFKRYTAIKDSMPHELEIYDD